MEGSGRRVRGEAAVKLAAAAAAAARQPTRRRRRRRRALLLLAELPSLRSSPRPSPLLPSTAASLSHCCRLGAI
jgi:hypothetical protein